MANWLPKRAWQQQSADYDAKGHRFHHWAVIDRAECRPDTTNS
ncbi:hypothetical protein [Streptomyces sp. NPDC056323]